MAYNRNRLAAPYIFQSHPALKGLKVLVDLNADGIALASTVGLNVKVSANWNLNIAYSKDINFSADGNLTGNLGQLNLGIEKEFAYDATIKTALPAILSAGLAWQTSQRLQLGFQYDFISWKRSFDELPIRLTQGTNGQLNAFLGENVIADTAPLNWHNQQVIHFGALYTLANGRDIRAGIENTNAQTPPATMTPMTGAILENVYSLGTNFLMSGTRFDVAYRYSHGPKTRVSNSALLAGEYNGSELDLDLHSLVLSISF
jgi:long-subunit fatty acid transport protein